MFKILGGLLTTAAIALVPFAAQAHAMNIPQRPVSTFGFAQHMVKHHVPVSGCHALYAQRESGNLWDNLDQAEHQIRALALDPSTDPSLAAQERLLALYGWKLYYDNGPHSTVVADGKGMDRAISAIQSLCSTK
jgi:hypothetical protein